MSAQPLLCPTAKRNSKTALLCPSVGLVRLLVADGQPVGAGQPIFELWRLNTCFLVMLPPHLCGTVMRRDSKDRFFAGFHDEVMEIEHTNMLNEQKTAPESAREGVAILSPMDGMFYLSPSPADPPFVKVGDELVPGQIIGLIEVMKCFYPLNYQGKKPMKLIAIHIKNATPVAAKTPIFEVVE